MEARTGGDGFGSVHDSPARQATLAGSCPSEIRLVRPRHFGVLSRVPLDVFGANRFHPVGGTAPISHGRGPRRREDAFILDRELELQVLARIARAPDPQGD